MPRCRIIWTSRSQNFHQRQEKIKGMTPSSDRVQKSTTFSSKIKTPTSWVRKTSSLKLWWRIRTFWIRSSSCSETTASSKESRSKCRLVLRIWKATTLTKSWAWRKYLNNRTGVQLTIDMTKKIRMTSYSSSRKCFSRDWTTNWQRKALANRWPRARPTKFHRLKLVAKTCKTTSNKFKIELGCRRALL